MSVGVPGEPQPAIVSALGRTFPAIVLYRILRGLPDIADEFDSYAKMGQQSRTPLTGTALERWGATSMYTSLTDARNVAQTMRATGRPVAGIAEVHLPTIGWFPMRQTGQNLHHWSVWGDTEHMSAFIVGSHPT
jgi:hypothetical protein